MQKDTPLLAAGSFILFRGIRHLEHASNIFSLARLNLG